MKRLKNNTKGEMIPAKEAEQKLPVFVFESSDIPVEPMLKGLPNFEFLADALAPFPKGKR